MPKSKELVSDSSDSDSDGAVAPPKKKQKEKKEESAKKKAPPSASKDGTETSFQLSKNRYVTVSEFRGKPLVNIREYYDAGGELKPGRKGIALNLEQWKALMDVADEINDALKEL